MSTHYQLKILQNANTAANWAAVNPVLFLGEFGFETDTRRLKIGNGQSYWNDLAYYTDGSVTPSHSYTGGYGIFVENHVVSSKLHYEEVTYDE